ncbi:MAG TPA: hypothetical protein PLZ80_15045, partial [Planctomycetota bacterium]|nr:hypothetical protein [Planctomycetota bacterium]
ILLGAAAPPACHAASGEAQRSATLSMRHGQAVFVKKTPQEIPAEPAALGRLANSAQFLVGEGREDRFAALVADRELPGNRQLLSIARST